MTLEKTDFKQFLYNAVEKLKLPPNKKINLYKQFEPLLDDPIYLWNLNQMMAFRSRYNLEADNFTLLQFHPKMFLTKEPLIEEFENVNIVKVISELTSSEHLRKQHSLVYEKDINDCINWFLAGSPDDFETFNRKLIESLQQSNSRNDSYKDLENFYKVLEGKERIFLNYNIFLEREFQVCQYTSSILKKLKFGATV